MSENFYPISGTNAVALTFDEEVRLAKSWLKQKDRTARDTLIKNYVLFSVKQVKKMYPSLSEDNAILVAHEALIESIDKFDPWRDKQGRLSNLIPYCAKMAFRNFRRRAETVKCPIKEATPEGGRYVSTSKASEHAGVGGAGKSNSGNKHAADGEDMMDIYNTAEASLDSLFESTSSAAEDYDVEERRTLIVAEIGKIPEPLREVLIAVYYEGKNYAEIARDAKPHPISREAVRQKHNRGLALLRDAVNKLEIFRK